MNYQALSEDVHWIGEYTAQVGIVSAIASQSVFASTTTERMEMMSKRRDFMFVGLDLLLRDCCLDFN